MILVIGGQAQGKLAWVREKYKISEGQIIDGAACDFAGEEINWADYRVLYGLHELLRRAMEQGRAEELAPRLLELPRHMIIICNEVGAGLVPLEPGERQWRELVGRACCSLAAAADEVWRIFCGLPQRLK